MPTIGYNPMLRASAPPPPLTAKIIPGEPATRTYGSYKLESEYSEKCCASFLSSLFSKVLKPFGRIRNFRLFRRSAKRSTNTGINPKTYLEQRLRRNGIAEEVIKKFKSDIESGDIDNFSAVSWTYEAKRHFSEITTRPPELTMPSMLAPTARFSGKILGISEDDNEAKFGPNYLLAMTFLKAEILHSIKESYAGLETDLEADLETGHQKDSFHNCTLRLSDSGPSLSPMMPASFYMSRTFR